MNKDDIEAEQPIEIVSLEELDEMMEGIDCPNCGEEITNHESDEWGLCPNCRADLESSSVANPYKPLDFNKE